VVAVLVGVARRDVRSWRSTAALKWFADLTGTAGRRSETGTTALESVDGFLAAMGRSGVSPRFSAL